MFVTNNRQFDKVAYMFLWPQNAEIHRNSSRDLRLSSLEERVLEMQAELSSKQVAL